MNFHDTRLKFAFDRSAGSVRRYDADGRLHLDAAPISKANVCPYAGREIPDWQAHGLDPSHIYQLYRDPEELAKAAPTFNNLPLLSRHVPVDARDHRPDLVIGSTGSNAAFVAPYLLNSIVVWSSNAIEAIQDGTQRELSSAYRYRYEPGSGNFEGERFDGRMVSIVGNHIAVVPEGRVGKDVVIGDSISALMRRSRDYGAAADADFFTQYPGAARIKINL